MSGTETHLAERIALLNDNDLVVMLTVNAEQYRPEALELAKAEASRRGLALVSPAPEPVPPALQEVALSALRAAGDALGPGQYSAAGKAVVCSHCGGDRFEQHQALLNTRALTFFNLDWLNRAGAALLCESCGLIQWFATPPERL